jgi:hypothetical protein
MVDRLVVEENGMTVTGDRGRIALCESLKVRQSSTGWLKTVLKTCLPGWRLARPSSGCRLAMMTVSSDVDGYLDLGGHRIPLAS